MRLLARRGCCRDTEEESNWSINQSLGPVAGMGNVHMVQQSTGDIALEMMKRGEDPVRVV